MNKWHLVWLSLIGIACQSCASSVGESSVSNPFEGVPVLEISDPLDITDEQAADTDEFFFNRLPGMTFGRNGGIFVSHSNPDVIYHFAADGSYRGTIGSEGQGPGEFQARPRIAVAGDTLHALDTQANRVNRFIHQNEEWVFLDAFLLDQKEGYHTSSIHQPGSNRLLVEYAMFIRSLPEGDQDTQTTRMLELRSSSGGVIDESWLTIPEEDQFVYSSGAVQTSRTLPYGARSLVDIGPDNRLYHLLTSEFRIRMFDAGGAVVDSIVYPSLRNEIGDELRQEEVDNIGIYTADANTQRAMEQQYYEEIPAFGPALTDMHVDRETGRIIVRRPPVEDEPDWLLLDRDGTRLGVFSLDEDLRVFDFRRGKILGSVQKEDQLPTVRVVTIPELISTEV